MDNLLGLLGIVVALLVVYLRISKGLDTGMAVRLFLLAGAQALLLGLGARHLLGAVVSTVELPSWGALLALLLALQVIGWEVVGERFIAKYGGKRSERAVNAANRAKGLADDAVRVAEQRRDGWERGLTEANRRLLSAGLEPVRLNAAWNMPELGGQEPMRLLADAEGVLAEARAEAERLKVAADEDDSGGGE